MGYQSYLSNYANACYQLGRKTEALKIMEKMLPERRDLKLFTLLLMEAGRPLEAFLGFDMLLRNGVADPKVLESMRKIYTQLNGSNQGFDTYVKQIQETRLKARRQEIAQSIISEPAPDFTLKDVEENVVTLSNLRGKVVVLDFWATWCGPCKRSFPAMQKAVNKYKDDPYVEFLFIHTWERDEDATNKAIQFLKENGYTFRLLMDIKDPKTKANEVVKKYGVNGIPAKFIIDPQGNIRFKTTGASGSEDDMIDELSQMIEIARNHK